MRNSASAGNARKGFRRILAFTVALFIVISSLPMMALAATTPVTFGITNVKGVNLRSSVKGSTVHQVEKGTVVQILSTTTSNNIAWDEVYYSGRVLYAQSQYITSMSQADSDAYALANPAAVYTGTSTPGTGTGSGTGTTTTTTGKIKTTASVNLRKSASTSSAKLATVPMNTTLSFDKKVVSGSSVFYHVTYGNLHGYLLSSFVKVVSSSVVVSGNPIGTVTATTNAVIRATAQLHGTRTGLMLAKGATADLLLPPVVNDDYTWYFIETKNGKQGYVRGDCVTTTYGGGSTPVTPGTPSTPSASTGKTYVTLNSAMTIGGRAIAAGTALQLVTTVKTKNTAGVECYTVYSQSEQYLVPVADVKVLTADEFVAYIKTNVWTRTSFESLKRSDDIVGSVEVHALQLALKQLNYYGKDLDGDYGRGTESAVKSFQKAYKLEVDGFAGTETQTTLYAVALGTGGGGTGGGGSTPTPSTTKSYVQLTAGTTLFSTTTLAAAVTAPTGSVLQLVSTTAVKKNNVDYYGIYYNNDMYYVPVAAVPAPMTEAQLNTYITTVLWRATSYTNINDDTEWVGSVLVHGLQLALKTLGFYTGPLDGDFGSGSKSAVRNFQRSYRLDVDGRAGNDTQGTLYPLAIAKYSGGGGGGGGTGGGGTPITVTGDYLATLSAGVRVYLRASTSGNIVRELESANTVLKLASNTTVAGTGGTFYRVAFGETGGYVLTTAVKTMTAAEYGTFLTNSTTGTVEATYGYKLSKGSKDRNFPGKYVSTMQARLQYLGFYFNEIDGDFGSGTLTAVQNFQKTVGLTVDGIAASNTLHRIYGTVEATSGTFGAISSITKGTWFTQAGGNSFGTVPGKFYPSYLNAKVMDCLTGMVFSVKRWSGGYHADVEPMTANDTKIMCNIYGVSYPSGSPSASTINQLSKRDSSGNPLAYWPNINYAQHYLRRPVLVNLGGEVFCGSMMGVAHNYPDGDTLSNNNFYGQFCLHFWFSRTHSGATTETWDSSITGYSGGGSRSTGYSSHKSAINAAYEYAKTNYPGLTR